MHELKTLHEIRTEHANPSEWFAYWTWVLYDDDVNEGAHAELERLYKEWYVCGQGGWFQYRG